MSIDDLKNLMIDNWLFWKGIPRQVHSSTFQLYQAEMNFYEPIPLSPDILSKIEGFKHVVSNIYKIPISGSNTLFLQVQFNEKDIIIGIKNEAGYITINAYRNYYVHQLQNLIFCLTGKELIINL